MRHVTKALKSDTVSFFSTALNVFGGKKPSLSLPGQQCTIYLGCFVYCQWHLHRLYNLLSYRISSIKPIAYFYANVIQTCPKTLLAGSKVYQNYSIMMSQSSSDSSGSIDNPGVSSKQASTEF